MISYHNRQVAHREIDHIFQDLFPSHGMTARPSQIELSHKMLDAMIHSKIALSDAGTGIGKTYAYLVAGVSFSRALSRENIPFQPILISTSSIALQTAVREEYIPFLSSVLLEDKLIQAPIRAVIRKGKGHYVGVYMAWGLRNNGWWGEGEMKFFIDGDKKFPTICTTGTEDYFCGSYNFDRNGQFTTFCTPYAGLCQVIRPDGNYRSQERFGLYRWHLCDPIRFRERIRVTIQALGWRSGGRYLPLQDDIASVAFWYQDTPAHTPHPLPEKDQLEVI